MEEINVEDKDARIGNEKGLYPICFWRVSRAVENGDDVGLKIRSCTSFAAWLFCTQNKILHNTIFALLTLRLVAQKKLYII